MVKAARKRAASTDSGGSASSSAASSSKRDGSKRARQAEPESVRGTLAPSLDVDASDAGPSETTTSAAPLLKILNFNANGILKAFERSGKRLDKLLREEGALLLAECLGGAARSDTSWCTVRQTRTL